MIEDDPWLVRLRSSPGAVALVCVPYAGGMPGVFAAMARGLPGVDVFVAQLPGHGRRIRERPLTSIEEIVEGLSASVARVVDGPCVVLGHSMGGLVGIELARALPRGPEHFIVSACRAPSQLGDEEPWHLLSDDDLIKALVSLGADPAPFAVQELRELALPVLRGDLEAIDGFDRGERPVLRCPITAVAGTRDPDAKPELMLGWERETSAGFRAHAIDGGHFLLEERLDAMVDIVQDVLGQVGGVSAG